MSDIIDAIDNALTDYAVSPDAMRWSTDADVITEAQKARSDRFADYVTFALDLIERRLPPAIRDPDYAPKPVVLGEDSYLRREEGWMPAVSGPLRFKRECLRCNKPQPVVQGVKAPWVDLNFWVTEQTVVEPTRLEMCQMCEECRTPFDGPMLLAQRSFDKTRWANGLRLAAGGDYVVMTLSEDAAAYPECVEIAWFNLERELLDHITYRRPCVVDDCQEKARTGWQVRRPVTAEGWTLTPGPAELCMRHNYELETSRVHDGYLPLWRPVEAR